MASPSKSSFFPSKSVSYTHLQHVLFGIPFYITILVLAALAWMKAGRGTAIFTTLGLLLIYGMGFWEATMQTLALVFSSTCLALIVGVPLGVWTANSPRAEKILRPVLDLSLIHISGTYFIALRMPSEPSAASITV